MNTRIYGWAVLSVLMIGMAGVLAGCNDMGYADDVTDLQSQQRINRGIPGPTELPPGLGDDLPAAAAAPPIAANK